MRQSVVDVAAGRGLRDFSFAATRRRMSPGGRRSGPSTAAIWAQFPVFVHDEVGLWVREVGGAVGPGADVHDLVGPLRRGEYERMQPDQDRARTAIAAGLRSTVLLARTTTVRRPGRGRWPRANPSNAALGAIDSNPTRPVRVVQRIFRTLLARSPTPIRRTSEPSTTSWCRSRTGTPPLIGVMMLALGVGHRSGWKSGGSPRSR